MKLELLLEREPIGPLTEQTLSRVWSQRYGTPFTVQWLPRGTADSRSGRRPGQSWVCNARLNVIFLPDAPSGQLEPIRREFGRSLVRWRQPLQSAYLRLALSSRLASAFRCATLAVTPQVPDGNCWIIIPGNHKIRLLNRSEQICLVATKHGFPRESILRELDVHARAASLKLPVVPIVESSGDGSWYLERYLSATPLNRLTSVEQARQISAQVFQHLRRLFDDTLEYRPAAAYADQLAADLHALIGAANLPARFQLEHLAELIERLVGLTRSSTWSLPIGQTHGDCQPANILVKDDEFWIIDWELTRLRQAAYDPLVFFLAARFPRGLADRMQSFNGFAGLPATIVGAGWATNEQHQPARWRTRLAIFLLEELQWRLEQLAPSAVTGTGGSIEQFLAEAHAWTRQQPVL